MIHEGDQVYRPYDDTPCEVVILWDDGTAFVRYPDDGIADEWGSGSMERIADLELITQATPDAGAKARGGSEMSEMRDYVVRWPHEGRTTSRGTSPVEAVKEAIGPSEAKRVYRLGSIRRGVTLVQIIWPNGKGDQVEVHLQPKRPEIQP